MGGKNEIFMATFQVHVLHFVQNPTGIKNTLQYSSSDVEWAIALCCITEKSVMKNQYYYCSTVYPFRKSYCNNIFESNFVI